MARLLHVATPRVRSLAGALLLTASTATLVPVQADPPAPAPPPVAASNAAPKVPAPPQPPPPPTVPESFNRYGKIWAPTDDAEHPFKLSVMFPGVGELKVPSQEELTIRDKLEQLASLTDEDVRKQLADWPPFSKMSLRDEGQLLGRIQGFKEQRRNTARDVAKQLGLLTLTPQQQDKFEKEYWQKRLQADRELAKQFEPILKARQEKMLQELFAEFSSPPATPKNLPKAPAPATTASTNLVPVGQTPPPAK